MFICTMYHFPVLLPICYCQKRGSKWCKGDTASKTISLGRVLTEELQQPLVQPAVFTSSWDSLAGGVQHDRPGLGFEASQMSSQGTVTIQDNVKWPLLQEIQFGKSKNLVSAFLKKIRNENSEPCCGCWGGWHKFWKFKLLIENTNIFNFSLTISDYKWRNGISFSQ